MYTLKTFLQGHELRLYQTQTLAADSMAFDKVHFDFDDSWAGLTKMAFFWGAEGTAYGTMLDAEDNAVIPWEALQEHGRIRFGVCGTSGSGDGAVRATSTLINYMLPEGAWDDSAVTPTPAEQSLIEQAIAAIQSAVDNLDKGPIVRNGIWYTWDINIDDYASTGVAATGPVGPQGPQGPMGDVTPAAQQAASDAQTAAQAASGSSQAAAGSAADAAASAQDAEDAAAGIAANLSAIQSSVAIIVDGNTVTTTIAEGQYVYIKGSTILAEGLYTANSAVPSGTVITAQTAATYFTAVSGGGLNAIQQSMVCTQLGTGSTTGTFTISDASAYRCIILVVRGYGNCGSMISPYSIGETFWCGGEMGENYKCAFRLNSATSLTVVSMGDAVGSWLIYGFIKA